MADYTWSPDTGRYRSVQTGRYVAEATIRADVERVIAAGQQRIAALTARLVAGDLAPVLWRAQMAATLSSAHLTAASLAHGGWGQLDGGTQLWTARRLRSELQYLADFTREMEAGALSPAQIGARAAQYGESPYTTYQERRRADAGDRGHDQERNLLGAAQHCDGCAGATSQGWVPLGTLAPIGGRPCRSRCRCRIATRRTRVRVGV